MPDIKNQKLLYHLTKLENIPSILERGLQPRANLQSFADIADPEIIANRCNHKLENYVPFHWFARNPFDGRVQRDHPGESFVLIAVWRSLAQHENWKVIPQHPLNNTSLTLMDYTSGFAAIHWETMNRRNYFDPDCKSVYMAECLSPRTVLASEFCYMFVPNKDVENSVKKYVDEYNKQIANQHGRPRLSLEIILNAKMFLR